MELFTVFALVCALAAAASAVVAYRNAVECAQHAYALGSYVARMQVIEAEFDAYKGQLAKLRGKVYSLKPEPVSNGDTGDRVWLNPPYRDTSTACENWLKAQSEGPRSPAASCECGYCVSMRAERAATRAAILHRPRTKGE